MLSELDGSRRQALLNEIGDIQTIITCTGYDEFVNSRLTIDRLLQVTNGSVAEAAAPEQGPDTDDKPQE